MSGQAQLLEISHCWSNKSTACTFYGLVYIVQNLKGTWVHQITTWQPLSVTEKPRWTTFASGVSSVIFTSPSTIYALKPRTQLAWRSILRERKNTSLDHDLWSPKNLRCTHLVIWYTPLSFTEWEPLMTWCADSWYVYLYIITKYVLIHVTYYVCIKVNMCIGNVYSIYIHIISDKNLSIKCSPSSLPDLSGKVQTVMYRRRCPSVHQFQLSFSRVSWFFKLYR